MGCHGKENQGGPSWKKTHSKSVGYNRHLPFELAEDILPLLPVKDVLRCRAVCKPWKSLIDSNSFKDKHFAQSAKRPTRLILHRADLGTQPTIDFLSGNNEVSSSLPLDFNQLLENLVDRVHCFYEFGCVHGLLCLMYENCYVVWNPSTKQHRVIKPPPEHWVKEEFDELKLPGEPFGAHFMDFGLDLKTQDFKFLKALLTKEQGKAMIQLYSLRTNSWKRIVHDFPFAVTGLEAGDGYLDGSIYWFAVVCFCKDDKSSEPAVIRFDFSDEIFKLIRLPNDNCAGSRGNTVIAVTTRGCLVLIKVPPAEGINQSCEIWTMGRGVGN